MTFSIGFYIYAGWGSRSQCVTEGLEVSQFVIQDDMKGRRWLRPGNTSDVVTPARLVDSISGRRNSYGGVRFDWNMQNLSPKMVKYIRDTFFGGGYSAQLTVQTFNRGSGEWECYQVYGKMPNERDSAEAMAGGYNNYIISFVGGVAAPETHDLALSVGYLGDIQAGSNLVLQIALNNEGDAATYTITYLTLQLGGGNEYVTNTTPTNWTDEFSNDGVTYYSSVLIAPFTAAEVTHIRWVYVLNFGAGVTFNFNVTWTFTEGGIQTNTLTVGTVGDVDESDNVVDVIFNPAAKGFSSGFNDGFGG